MIRILCGAPGSGKTTYMMDHRKDGDMVIDVAWLYTAISGSQGPIKDNSLLPYALAMRNMLYDMIQQRNDVNTWILAGAPVAEDREAMAQRFGVEVMLVNKTRKQCLAQVKQDDRRKEDQQFFIWLVNDWFDRYTPRDADVLIG
jgi:predicted kinase